MAGGRPTKYTVEITDRICELTATTSRSLKSICEEVELSPSAVLEWLASGKHKEFTEKYARAKEMQADVLFEEIIEIADDGTKDTIHSDKGDFEDKEWTSRSKLRVDARKWAASKLAPKKYGDKVEHTGNMEVAITGMKIM